MPPQPEWTLRVAFDRFLLDRRAGRAKATFRYYRRHVALIGMALPLDAPVTAIKEEHVLGYLARRSEEVSPKQANKELRTLKTFFRWLRRRRIVKMNPARFVAPALVRSAPTVPAVPADVIAFVAALRASASTARTRAGRHSRDLMADALEVLWATGLRIGELSRLAPRDTDLARDTMTIRSAWNKGPRVIPIPQQVRGIVERRLALANALGSAFVFCGCYGGDPYNALYSLRSKWLAAHGADDVARRCKFHALRHGYADTLRRAGVDAVVREKLMGHTDSRTAGRYNHPDMEELRRAAEATSGTSIEQPSENWLSALAALLDHASRALKRLQPPRT